MVSDVPNWKFRVRLCTYISERTLGALIGASALNRANTVIKNRIGNTNYDNTKVYDKKDLLQMKTGFLHMRKQRRRSASRLNREADHSFVFASHKVQSLYFLNLKLQVSGHLLWLYSPACVGPGWKSRRPVFSQRGSYKIYTKITALEQETVIVHFLIPVCVPLQ